VSRKYLELWLEIISQTTKFEVKKQLKCRFETILKHRKLYKLIITHLVNLLYFKDLQLTIKLKQARGIINIAFYR